MGVVTIDDHHLLSDLLGAAIDGEQGMHHLGSADTHAAAQDLLHIVRPDVVILEIRLPGPSGRDGLRTATHLADADPRPRTIVLTDCPDPSDLATAAALGACAYLSKRSHLSDVLDTIRRSQHGTLIVENRTLRSLEQGRTHPGNTHLTAREYDVINALKRLSDTRQVATELRITTTTLAWYLRSLHRKLNCHTTLELVTTAVRQGLVEPIR